MSAAGSDVRFPADGGHSMRAFLATPTDAARPRPSVIVIHEIFGLNDDIRRIATRFAEAGYVTLAPDLFDGPGPRALCVARTLWATQAGEGRAFRDLEAARLWLAERPDVDPERTGMAGFCLGGSFALLYARRAPIGVTAPFYGEVPAKADDLRGICPVVGGYGARDLVFGRQGTRLQRLLDELEVASDVVVYPDAGHSFMSQHEPGILRTLGSVGPLCVGYDPHAAEDSWRRMLAFFAEHLGTP